MPQSFKITFLLLASLLLSHCEQFESLLGISEPREGDIDLTLFTNDALRACVARDNSGVIDTENVIFVACVNSRLKNLDGLEQFTNLRALILNRNLFIDIDLTPYKKLGFVDLSANSLQSLDLSENKEIKEVFLDDNKLTELNTDENPLLEALVINDNKIERLDFSKNPLLEELRADENSFSGDVSLGDLDLSGNTNLIKLHLRDNEISNIDLANNLNIDELYLDNNMLASVDFINNDNVSDLRVKNNLLTSLNLTFSSELRILDASDNMIDVVSLPLNEKLQIVSLANNFINCGLPDCSVPNARFQIPRNESFVTLNLSSNLLEIESLDLKQNLDFSELNLSGNETLIGSLDLIDSRKLVDLAIDNTGITSLDFGSLISPATTKRFFESFNLQFLSAVDADLDMATKDFIDALETDKDNELIQTRFIPESLTYRYQLTPSP